MNFKQTMDFAGRIRFNPYPLIIIVLFLLASPVQAQAARQGNIVFDETFFDFGVVTEGDVVKHTFKFKNEGKGIAGIETTETSCGCTTASGTLKTYKPGERGEMAVEVDTKDKKGIIIKTVTVKMTHNEKPSVELSLAMKLEPPPHPKIVNARNINTDAACKACHLESGAGQSGIFLYHRVCSQCHGKKGMGGVAHALNDASWQRQASDVYIAKVIHAGLPEKGMPAFVEGVTPALTDTQIDTLIKYIRSMVQP